MPNGHVPPGGSRRKVAPDIYSGAGKTRINYECRILQFLLTKYIFEIYTIYFELFSSPSADFILSS